MLILSCSDPRSYRDFVQAMDEIGAETFSQHNCLEYSATALVDERVAFLRIDPPDDSLTDESATFRNNLNSIRDQQNLDIVLSVSLMDSCKGFHLLDGSPLIELANAPDTLSRQMAYTLRFSGVGKSVQLLNDGRRIASIFSSVENSPGLSSVDRFIIRFPDRKQLQKPLMNGNLQIRVDNLYPGSGLLTMTLSKYHPLPKESL